MNEVNSDGKIDGIKSNANTDILVKKLKMASGLYDRIDIKRYDKFARFGVIDPYTRNTGVREYVFITKPDLHIFSNNNIGTLNSEISNMTLFKDANKRYSRVLEQLQYSCNRANPFVNLLSNSKSSNLELPGISADEIETSANLYGTRLFYRNASTSSDSNFDFSMEFEDTKYLEVYMWFKLYDEYHRKKKNGDITPPHMSYTTDKILHDQMSIFKFIVSDDGETILYFAEFWGCFPKTTPRDVFGDMSADGQIKYTIQWKATFVEDMDPSILEDFNALTSKIPFTKELPLYDTEIGMISGEWATSAYVVQEKEFNSGNIVYKLKWRA